jgi:hypothetical protein
MVVPALAVGVPAGGVSHEPPRPLEGRALENLVAFTRLLGYVRFFHPSDEALTTDWDAFAVKGIRCAEDAKSPDDLAAKLETLFHPVAPTVRVVPGAAPAKVPAHADVPPDDAGLLKVTAWCHFGVGLGDSRSKYYSKRVVKDLLDPSVPGSFLDPAQLFTAELGGGVHAMVPTALYVVGRHTHPRATTTLDSASPLPHASRASGNDRATRLAGIALAWNVFQHFYPYFDVVKTDWDAALRTALTAAAVDSDEHVFADTLRRLMTALRDGHGSVSRLDSGEPFAIPIAWDWIEDRLVVTHVSPGGAGGLKPGDVVLTVNGKPVAEVLSAKQELISTATPQWFRVRALNTLATGKRFEGLTLEVARSSGERHSVTLLKTVKNGALEEPRPAKIEEIEPGIFYVDIDRITKPDFQAAILQLEAATGIVFDLRGYPADHFAPSSIIAHLIDEPVTSPQWHIPVVTRPDRKELSFELTYWIIQPESPRLRAKVAFMTDGRAVSAAETTMGIIEHYKVGPIVGGPTAGTNGNVNPFILPGGYRISWTGMKVLKHDGSQHHGVGILPTVPCSRTIKGVIAGRDEVLERALEIVRP